MDEPQTNATEELDVNVDAVEPLPANGTIIVDISNEDDVDIDTIPPVGVSTIVTNTIVTVTNNLVEISKEVEHHPLIQKDLAPKPLLATVKIKEQRVQTVTKRVVAAGVQQTIVHLTKNRGRPYSNCS